MSETPVLSNGHAPVVVDRKGYVTFAFGDAQFEVDLWHTYNKACKIAQETVGDAIAEVEGYQKLIAEDLRGPSVSGAEAVEFVNLVCELFGDLKKKVERPRFSVPSTDLTSSPATPSPSIS